VRGQVPGSYRQAVYEEKDDMSGRIIGTTVVVFAALCLMGTLVHAAERMTGTVQAIDAANTTFMLATEDGKVTKLSVAVDFLEDLEKGKKVEVLVEDGIVIAVDKASKAED
jgi:hypothetical protein